MKASLVIAAALLSAALLSCPLFYSIYEPMPSGSILQTVPFRIANDIFGARAILSERVGHPTDLVDSAPRERVVSIYRFKYPFWRRVDEQSGTNRQLFADTTWGASKKFTGSYVGYKVSILGAGPLSPPDDDLVIKTREVALSGQWATGYVIAGLRGNSLKRLASVDGLWDVDAHITAVDSEGVALLHLHGVETAKEPPFLRSAPQVDADIYYDGVHWLSKDPAGPTFGLTEPSP